MSCSNWHLCLSSRAQTLWLLCVFLLLIWAAVFGPASETRSEEPGYPPAIRCLSFSPDGRLLAAAASDQFTTGRLAVWDVETLKPRFTHQEPVGFPSVAFSPDGRILALARFAPEAALFDVETGKLLEKLRGHTNHARCVTFSPDGKKLITGSYDRTIKIWDLATRKVEATLEGHSEAVYHVEVSPDGRLLASADARADTARLWDLTTKKQLHAFADLGSLVPHVTFSPDGRLVATASWAGHLSLFDTKSYQRWLRIHEVGGVHWAAFSPDQRWLAVATNAPTLRVFNVDTRPAADTRAKIEILLAQLKDDSYKVRERATEALAEIGMAAEPRLREAMQSEVPEVRWRARRLRDRLSTPESAVKLQGHQGELESVCFSPDGKLLASGDDAGEIRIWHVGKWKPVGKLSITEQPAPRD